jgi:hypothetical protein
MQYASGWPAAGRIGAWPDAAVPGAVTSGFAMRACLRPLLLRGPSAKDQFAVARQGFFEAHRFREPPQSRLVQFITFDIPR